jgi:hypothetical protein
MKIGIAPWRRKSTLPVPAGDEPAPTKPSYFDRIERAWRARFGTSMDPTTLIEPTPDERRNGWTPETLTAYLAERERAVNQRLSFPRKPPLPPMAHAPWSPHRTWRRAR